MIQPRSPGENGYSESISWELWDEFLNPDVFSRVGEAKVLVEARTLEYNGTRPHSFPGIPATGF